MGSTEDAGLASLRASDDALFAAFVLRNQRRLRRTAYLICGDRHRAEDVVQTAFAQVYSRWTRVCAAGGPEGYRRLRRAERKQRGTSAFASEPIEPVERSEHVHRAVVNAAIDEKRRPWRRERATDVLPERPSLVDDGLTAELLAALGALGKRQRAVVVLRYRRLRREERELRGTSALDPEPIEPVDERSEEHVEDLDVETTAHLLGISPGTVKSQAARGLATLRDLLQNGALR
ncbi:MAG: sigma-70 family RNA polymerase sigma factor [Sporichthyaceae bacterium]